MVTVDSLFLLKAARFSILSALEAALIKTSILARCLRIRVQLKDCALIRSLIGLFPANHGSFFSE